MSDVHPDPYSIKRHGTNVRDCEAEPIQSPGCIQSHGALIAVRASDLTILQVSENSAEFFGRLPQALLGQGLQTLLPCDHIDRLRAVIDREPIERNPLYVSTIGLEGRGSTSAVLDLSVHTIGGCAILEFELTGSEGGNSPPDYYSLVKTTAARLHEAQTLESFCTVAAQQVRRVTGLDRVMIYRFHADASGEVFAEDKRSDLSAWRGQRYPAYDIPKIARDIFKKLTVRPLQDARGELAELVPLINPDTGRALELTHCALRGASVMYTEYLSNMNVAASLTMPIVRDNELWGMIACHHGTPTRFSFQMRAAAELIAQIISLELRVVDDREQLSYVHQMDAVHLGVIARAAAEGGLPAMMAPPLLLSDGIRCSGAALLHRNQWWKTGRTPQDSHLEELGTWLRDRLLESHGTQAYFATDHLSAAYPAGSQLLPLASGVLAVPVTRDCRTLILWFRPEITQTVRWAGNPHEKPLIAGPNGPRLTPRASFEVWQQAVRERCVAWQPVEIAAALRLRMLAMELVLTAPDRTSALDVDRPKSNEELNVLAFAVSQELRDPLRSVHDYASYLRKDAEVGGTLSAVARERLDSLLRLTGRMGSVIDSLLEFSRVGRRELKFSTVALEEVVHELIAMLGPRIADRGAKVIIPRPLPHIYCDRVRVREVFSNLMDNALKYNDSAVPHVEIGYQDAGERAPPWSSWSPEASKVLGRVFHVRDNGIGIEPRHHERIFAMFKRLHPREDHGGGAGAGLAITRKLIEQHGGSIWVDSRPGEGTTFFFTLSRAE
jgi:two-component system, chemotaxis family, sensor kinase Cph1